MLGYQRFPPCAVGTPVSAAEAETQGDADLERSAGIRVLRSRSGDRLLPIWAVALDAGLRRGELLGLKWDDVDLDGGRIAVRRSRVLADGVVVVENTPKSDRARTISIAAGTVSILRR